MNINTYSCLVTVIRRLIRVLVVVEAAAAFAEGAEAGEWALSVSFGVDAMDVCCDGSLG